MFNKKSVYKNIFKNKVVWVLLLVICVGAFLRVFHFGDWMHFQLDQARDFRVISAAMEYGPGELPLQGPRAAGSFLRLGPLLYYLEYGSALIFGNNPVGSVVIIGILNVLTIPLFFLLVRIFFGNRLSVGLTGIFATSLFMVSYSRFGWNPNLIPFFSMLMIYALLNIRKDKPITNGRWLTTATAALVAVSNMHFLALIAMSVIVGIYLIWLRPRILVKYWLLACLVFVFLNIPLIVNDFKTGGDNFHEFLKAVSGHSKTEEKHGFTDKIIRNVELHAQYNLMILTGYQSAIVPLEKKFKARCKNNCFKSYSLGIVSLGLLIIGIFAGVKLYQNEKNSQKKNFLRFSLLWGVIVFVLYTPLAYDIAPRFFLLNAPLFIIMLGLLLKLISLKYSKGKIIRDIVVMSLICINLVFVVRYFNELRLAGTQKASSLEYSDRILKEKTRVTFEQMSNIVFWMNDKQQKSGFPVFFYAQPEYATAFGGILKVNRIPYDYINSKLKILYKEGEYFVILRAQSNQEKGLSAYKEKMNIIESKQFGTLIGYYLKPKNGAVLENRKIFETKSRDPRFSDKVQRRYLWRQIFE